MKFVISLQNSPETTLKIYIHTKAGEEYNHKMAGWRGQDNAKLRDCEWKFDKLCCTGKVHNVLEAHYVLGGFGHKASTEGKITARVKTDMCESDCSY